MEVQIISRESIKPSSPTPLDLKTHKLCLLDQFRNNVYAPRVLYYPLNQDDLSSAIDIDHIVSKRLQLLKQSLSETLVRFYPLAGKLTNNFSVDCNDEGVYFVEAVAKSLLNELLIQPDPNLRNKLFPVDGSQQRGQVAGAHVAKVQVTSFACGGLVICACISHTFGDGTSFSSFMKAWAATARNKTSEEEATYTCPNYDASSLFLPNEDDLFHQLRAISNASYTRFFETGRFVTKRFVFDAEAIAELKDKAKSSRVQNPTRIEALSAILSRSIMAVLNKKSSSHSPTLLSHVVNLRTRARPPLSEYLIGNIVWATNALCTEEEVDFDGLVWLLREAISKFDGDFVKNLQGGGGLLELSEAIKHEAEAYSDAKNRILFSSWCTFGSYGIDFGWGKPIWVSCVGFDGSILEFSPVVILMDTRFGDGIEAWVSLLEEDMALLEVDKNLLEFATIDPSPLKLAKQQ
ncbi:hypothetical protein AB3S75_000412 [Citrus x aurantiifolia]